MCSINLMIKIIYQDEFILVIDKPAGLLSIADGYDPSLPHVRSLLEPDYGRLWIIHRLDKDTSGVLILARSARVHQRLNDQFSDRKIVKQYKALVFGNFPDQQTISLPLLVNGDRRHRTVVNIEKGKEASTEVGKTEYFQENNCSLIEAFPHTGYTHQIRAHLFSQGFPILSDPLYFTPESKTFSENLPIHRTALHAYKISFPHPFSNLPTEFSAEPPKDFSETIEYLQQKRASS